MSNALKTSEENREKDDILKESERLEIEKKVELARENLRKILKYFDVFDYDESFSLEGNLLKIELKGDNLDFLIRSEGKLLNAIQYVVVLMTNNVYEGHIKIVLDCNGFRERRKEEIKDLVKRLIEKVKERNKEVALEPMNPFERRLVHAYVSSFDGVYSRSIGKDPMRNVVIYPDPDGVYKGKFFEMD